MKWRISTGASVPVSCAARSFASSTTASTSALLYPTSFCDKSARVTAKSTDDLMLFLRSCAASTASTSAGVCEYRNGILRSSRPARLMSESSLSGRLVIRRNRIRPRLLVSDMNSLMRAMTRDDVPPSSSPSVPPKARSPSSMITTTWPIA